MDKLARMEISAPWRPQYGFDGTDYQLTLQGAMSSIAFRWWATVPPEWETVGDVFNCVQQLERTRTAAE